MYRAWSRFRRANEIGNKEIDQPRDGISRLIFFQIWFHRPPLLSLSSVNKRPQPDHFFFFFFHSLSIYLRVVCPPSLLLLASLLILFLSLRTVTLFDRALNFWYFLRIEIIYLFFVGKNSLLLNKFWSPTTRFVIIFKAEAARGRSMRIRFMEDEVQT